MKLETERSRGRQRLRFNIKEIEKYSGSDVPETVIKNWLYIGRNLDKTLERITEITEKNSDSSTLQSMDYRLGELEESLKRLHSLLNILADSFVEVGRVLTFAATYQLKKSEQEPRELRLFLKERDSDYLSYFKEVFPEFRPGYLLKRFFWGGEK